MKAAIAKAYNGDIHAFAVLDRHAHEQFTTMLDVYERNLVSPETHGGVAARAERPGRERMLSGHDLEQGGPFARGGSRGLGGDAYLETLNVLVTLLESARPDLRGHSPTWRG